ncbi:MULTISPECIES: ERF family protein [Listeria]|uniref:ERF family protein n=1 Tax=Listeria TaxID=1637 RepID=UPI000B5907AA|nr:MULTISPECIES: ERF family protein [Listeria]
MEKSEEITEIAKSLCEFRENLKQPLKDASNPFFESKYVPLENIVEVIDDALKGTGLSYTQQISSDEQSVAVSTQLWHEEGEFVFYDPIKLPATKRDAQGFGSAATYARRYALSAVFGITSDQDDDGNTAVETMPKKIEANEVPIINGLVNSLSAEMNLDFNTTWETLKRKTKIQVDLIENLNTEQSGLIKKCINDVRSENKKKLKQTKKPSEQLPEGTERQGSML